MKSLLLLITALSSTSIYSQVETQVTTNLEKSDSEEVIESDAIYVIGSEEKAFYTPGSAHFIGQQELKKFDYTDIGRVLDKVPGVYIQEEDGLGLRPNIGLRGAHPHRSKKVNLMEDGVLSGPAPYSAPAAYYFPSTSRSSSLEVFKGPSSVLYGPNSIGGAVNIVTRPISQNRRNEIDYSFGSPLQKLELTSSNTVGNFGYLIHASRKNGDLVRQIDNQDNLSFEQYDVLSKMRFVLPAGNQQRIDLKVSYSTEESDESYLGISNDDFQNNPYNRYEASRDDNMNWQRASVTATYHSKPAASLTSDITFYHHDFKRDWYKFNELAGFDPNALSAALGQNSGTNLAALLRGERDSAGSSEQLIFGGNDRNFLSQGIAIKEVVSFDTGEDIYHDLTVGVRLHRDRVERNHTEINAVMENGRVSYLENTQRDANRTIDESLALSLSLQDEINTGSLTTLVGTRVEHVQTKHDKRIAGLDIIEADSTIVVPGIGFNYGITDDMAIFTGANRGVTLVGPGQTSDIDPEESMNYELGFRIKAPFYFESTAFFSDYENIKGTCSFSSGCTGNDLEREFNGGKAKIYGLEMAASHTFVAGKNQFPMQLNYTYTSAKFDEQTTSENADWGIGTINAGDPLPYIPLHQLSFRVGVERGAFSFDINTLWKSEVADQAVFAGRQIIPSYIVQDISGAYRYSKEGKVYARIDNIFDNEYQTSLRPLGVRPGKPRSYSVGLNYVF